MTDTTDSVHIEDVIDALSYTEAYVSLYGPVAEAPPIPWEGLGLLRVEHLKVTYAWRTQLRDTSWAVSTVEVRGSWITDDGTPDPRHSHNPQVTMLLVEDARPQWLCTFLDQHTPTSKLAIGVPGSAAPGNVPHTRELGEWSGEGARLTDVTSYTWLQHVIHKIAIGNAPVLDMGPTRPGRQMLPTELAVTYRWGVVPHGPHWTIGDVNVTGPYAATERGRPDDRGTVRMPIAPDWAHRYAEEHLPVHVRLIEGESDSDVALRRCITAAQWYEFWTDRRGAAEDTGAIASSDLYKLHEREDDAAKDQAEMAMYLVEMLNDGAEIPRAWANNPRPALTTQTPLAQTTSNDTETP